MTEVHGAVNIPCNFCKETFTRNINLREHIIRAHPTGSTFQCPEWNCLTFATSASDLADHVRIFHGNCGTKRILSCFYCKVLTTCKRRLTDHLLTTHLSKPLKCLQCLERFWTSINLQKHHKEKHQTSVHDACLHCKNVISKKSMQFHLNISVCKKCGEKFPCNGLLYSHSPGCREKKRTCASVAGRKKYLEVRYLSAELDVGNFEKYSITPEQMKPILNQVNDNKMEFGTNELVESNKKYKILPNNDDDLSVDNSIADMDKIPSKKIISKYRYQGLRKMQKVQCALCNKFVSSKFQMICHLLSVHRIGKAKFNCKKCNKPFFDSYGFQRHTRTVKACLKQNYMRSNQQNVTTALTGPTSTNQIIRNQHKMKIIPGVSFGDLYKVLNIECPFCKIIVRSKNLMITHLVEVHKIGQGTFDCKKCNESFYCDIDFQRHVRKCKKSSCLEEGKIVHTSLTQSYIVNDGSNILEPNVSTCHPVKTGKIPSLQIIAGPKPSDQKKSKRLECDICHSTLQSKQTMKIHLLGVHGIGKGKFVCQKCNKSFYYNCDFQRHVVRSCQKKACRKTSPTLNIFGQISIDFLKVKKIECALCYKTMRSKPSMIVHLLGVHGIGKGKFECKKCSKTFHYESRFRRHIYTCGRCSMITFK